jgi:uroporphyrin-III C-methyltransferase/precorrin-2 dehydrogenase/sirohydrochlorin ferrochelatase
MRNLLPLFIDLAGRDVLLVGGGPVAAGKLQQLLAAGATVRVVSPLVVAEIASTPKVQIALRKFQSSDLDGAWLVVAAATSDVNREVADAAEERRVFVNAVDDPPNATAYLSGVVRRDEVTIAISTSGGAPALTALIREALNAVLPDDLADWVRTARTQRREWRRDAVPMEARKPLLLNALNAIYEERRAKAVVPGDRLGDRPGDRPRAEAGKAEVPWLKAPEDSWL